MNTNTARIHLAQVHGPRRDRAATAEAVLEYLRRTTALPAECIRPARFAAISRILGRVVADLDDAPVEVLADVFLFIFAVDDLVDEGELEPEAVALRLSQYALCAEGTYCPEVAFDPLAVCLSSISRRLRAAPLGASLWPEWVRRVREMLGAMVFEQEAAARAAEGAMPGLDAYLDAGRHSVGIALMSMTAWILIGEPEAVAALPRLVEAERHLSLACRLANDLRSYERELAEGSINALSITGVAGAPGLRRRLHDELEEGRELLAAVTADAEVARCARFLEGFASAVVELYATRDFHTQAA